MTDPVEEEERVLITPSGQDDVMTVAKVDEGRYRILDFFGCMCWFDDDPPEELGYGAILEAEDVEDGRLQVHRIMPDPSVSVVSGVELPFGFSGSRAYREFVRSVLEMGGHTEVVGGGILSAFVPKEEAEARGFDLREALGTAMDEWGLSEGEME